MEEFKAVGIPKSPIHMHGNHACMAIPHGHFPSHLNTRFSLHTTYPFFTHYPFLSLSLTTRPLLNTHSSSCMTILISRLSSFLSLHHVPIFHSLLIPLSFSSLPAFYSTLIPPMHGHPHLSHLSMFLSLHHVPILHSLPTIYSTLIPLMHGHPHLSPIPIPLSTPRIRFPNAH